MPTKESRVPFTPSDYKYGGSDYARTKPPQKTDRFVPVDEIPDNTGTPEQLVAENEEALIAEEARVKAANKALESLGESPTYYHSPDLGEPVAPTSGSSLSDSFMPSASSANLETFKHTGRTSTSDTTGVVRGRWARGKKPGKINRGEILKQRENLEQRNNTIGGDEVEEEVA